METRIASALKSESIAELQEVYRALCASDGPKFLVECRLVTKVIQKMQKVVLAGMTERLKAGDVEGCRAYMRRIDNEPTLAALVRSSEAKQVRMFVKIAGVLTQAQDIRPVDDDGLERPLDEQKQQLQALRAAIKSASVAGIDQAMLEAATKAELGLREKLSALEALHHASATQDIATTEACLKDAEATGVSRGEVQLHRDALLRVKLEYLLDSSPLQIESLRACLQEVQSHDGAGLSEEQIQEGWRVVYYEDLVVAMRSNDLQRLRVATSLAEGAGFEGEMARTLDCAVRRLEEAAQQEERRRDVLKALSAATAKRDLDRTRGLLREAEHSSIMSPIIQDAQRLLCEEELRMAVTWRVVAKVRLKIVEGIELGVDPHLVEAAHRLLDSEDPKAAAWARIREAMLLEDQGRLRQAIEAGKLAGVDESVVDEAEAKCFDVGTPKFMGVDEATSPFGFGLHDRKSSVSFAAGTFRQIDSALHLEDEHVESVQDDDEIFSEQADSPDMPDMRSGRKVSAVQVAARLLDDECF